MVDKQANKKETARSTVPIDKDTDIDALRKLSKDPDPVKRIQVARFIGDRPPTELNAVHRIILKTLAKDQDSDVRDAARSSMEEFDKLNAKETPISRIQEVRKPRRVLVLGLPGSGKTTTAEFLTKEGYTAVDADKVLLSWGGKELPIGSSLKYILMHPPAWDEDKLKILLEKNENKDLFVFGIVPNIWKFFDVFDKIYYLDADKETLTARLNIPRDNPYGTTDFQKKIAVKLVPIAARVSKMSGFEFINATLSTEQIASKILDQA